MDRKPPKSGAGEGRDERLKAALKANIARRKAQAKAREAGAQDQPPVESAPRDKKG
ncbi:MAG: hypothetical protein H6897_03480 [Rhodobacteraceae bacterium]|jgi:hypothetical protein|uniref:hypothetical protein n=1 Tax=Albidovulum sp. TaxID=1872424 RepID=UPI0026582A4C|nr:hypothetical protein [uncultured Defluviimonas sp.]MCC0068972.1 hypothetical protein [Paracoccaceae bacterium]